jgi:hypothetical protein
MQPRRDERRQIALSETTGWLPAVMTALVHHPLMFAVAAAWVFQLGYFAHALIRWRSNRTNNSDLGVAQNQDFSSKSVR